LNYLLKEKKIIKTIKSLFDFVLFLLFGNFVYERKTNKWLEFEINIWLKCILLVV